MFWGKTLSDERFSASAGIKKRWKSAMKTIAFEALRKCEIFFRIKDPIIFFNADQLQIRGHQRILADLKLKIAFVFIVLAPIHANAAIGNSSGISFSKTKILEANLRLRSRIHVKEKKHYQSTPLADAARDGNKNAVRRLLKFGVNVNARDDWGGTALIRAVLKGHGEIVVMLLAAKANPNYVDSYGESALSYAIKFRHEEILQLLIKAGADINLSHTKEGISLLMIASAISESSNTPEVQGGIRSTTLLLPSDFVQTLIEAGANVNHQSRDGETALLLAFQVDNLETLKKLLAAGANPNLRPRWRETALVQAVKLGRKEIVRLLLQAGADVNLHSKRHESPLALSRHYEYENAEIEELLRNAGASAVDLPSNQSFRYRLSLQFSNNQLIGVEADLASYWRHRGFSKILALRLQPGWTGGRIGFAIGRKNEIETFSFEFSCMRAWAKNVHPFTMNHNYYGGLIRLDSPLFIPVLGGPDRDLLRLEIGFYWLEKGRLDQPLFSFGAGFFFN
jgi:ankyrin repeat protein